MTQQTIDVGTAPNDGTGDFLRDAFVKANANFTELYGDFAGLPTTYQPLDSDLSAIAALSTTSFGRALLTLANAAALQSAAGLVIGTNVQGFSSRLSSLAGVTPAANGTYSPVTSITISNGLITAIS